MRDFGQVMMLGGAAIAVALFVFTILHMLGIVSF